jgi:hypothetical protein
VPTITALVAAVIAWLNRQQMKTPSGTTIGKQVESAHHVSLANNYRLQALSHGLELPIPAEVEAEELQAQPPDGDTLKQVRRQDG